MNMKSWKIWTDDVSVYSKKPSCVTCGPLVDRIVIDKFEFDKLQKDRDEIALLLDKYIRLMNGEEVELECTKPGHSAALILREKWEK